MIIAVIVTIYLIIAAAVALFNGVYWARRWCTFDEADALFALFFGIFWPASLAFAALEKGLSKFKDLCIYLSKELK